MAPWESAPAPPPKPPPNAGLGAAPASVPAAGAPNEKTGFAVAASPPGKGDAVPDAGAPNANGLGPAPAPNANVGAAAPVDDEDSGAEPGVGVVDAAGAPKVNAGLAAWSVEDNDDDDDGAAAAPNPVNPVAGGAFAGSDPGDGVGAGEAPKVNRPGFGAAAAAGAASVPAVVVVVEGAPNEKVGLAVVAAGRGSALDDTGATPKVKGDGALGAADEEMSAAAVALAGKPKVTAGLASDDPGATPKVNVGGAGLGAEVDAPCSELGRPNWKEGGLGAAAAVEAPAALAPGGGRARRMNNRKYWIRTQS